MNKKMKLFFWFCFVLLFYYSEEKTVPNHCPNYCVCDIYINLKRATCTNSKIVSIETSVSNKVQYLDLSYNYITQIDDGVFQKQFMNDLKILNVSNNKIGQVHMNAFDGLNQLKTLDLSFNALGYILEHWFRSLTSLRELYLRGNILGTSINDVQISSESLLILDISKCGIPSLNIDIFNKTPILEQINLSDNYLIQLNYQVIKPLKYLTILDVDNNQFHCNGLMKHLKKYTRHHGISYKDPCNQHVKLQKMEKFQRMISQVPVEEKNLWLYDDIEENYTNSTNKTNNSTNISYPNNIFLKIVEYSPSLSIVTPFIFGILIGLIIGCNSSTKQRKNRRKNIAKKRKSNRRRHPPEEMVNLVSTQYHLTQSTPAIHRKFNESQFQNNNFNTINNIKDENVKTVENIFESDYFKSTNNNSIYKPRFDLFDDDEFKPHEESFVKIHDRVCKSELNVNNLSNEIKGLSNRHKYCNFSSTDSDSN